MSENDRFLNPLGSTYKESIEVLLDAIFGSFEQEKVLFALENMVKIGCLYGYSFSEETGYISMLKQLMEEEKALLGLDSKLKGGVQRLCFLEQTVYEKVKEKLESLRKGDLKAKARFWWK